MTKPTKLRWILSIAPFVAILLFQTRGLAQSTQANAAESESARTSSSASSRAQPLDVRAGTKISAELQSAVDARTAKPGDQVVARVTKDVKEHGRTVIHKGDRLLGSISSAEANTAAKAKARTGSALAVTFDRLEQAGTTYSLNTVINSIFSAAAEPEASGSMMQPEPPLASGPAGAGGGPSRSGGGVLGGVGSTTGAVAGATAGVANSTVGGLNGAVSGTTDSTLGGTAGAGLAAPLDSIRITSQAQGQEQSGVGSVLSARHGDVRLESGTRMQFRVAGESEVGAPAKH